MSKVKKSDQTEILILVLAALWVVFSFVASVFHPEGNWFSRSGAIMVLLALFVEYRVGTAQKAKISEATVIAGLGISMPSELPKIKRRIAITALWFAIVGTLIWGYGDIVA